MAKKKKKKKSNVVLNVFIAVAFLAGAGIFSLSYDHDMEPVQKRAKDQDYVG